MLFGQAPIKRRDPRNKSRSHPPGKSTPDKRQTVVGRGLVVDPATRSNAKSTAYNRGNSSFPSPLTFAAPLSPVRPMSSSLCSSLALLATRAHTYAHRTNRSELFSLPRSSFVLFFSLSRLLPPPLLYASPCHLSSPSPLTLGSAPSTNLPLAPFVAARTKRV